jgi:hypothetical protein
LALSKLKGVVSYFEKIFLSHNTHCIRILHRARNVEKKQCMREVLGKLKEAYPDRIKNEDDI